MLASPIIWMLGLLLAVAFTTQKAEVSYVVSPSEGQRNHMVNVVLRWPAFIRYRTLASAALATLFFEKFGDLLSGEGSSYRSLPGAPGVRPARRVLAKFFRVLYLGLFEPLSAKLARSFDVGVTPLLVLGADLIRVIGAPFASLLPIPFGIGCASRLSEFPLSIGIVLVNFLAPLLVLRRRIALHVAGLDLILSLVARPALNLGYLFGILGGPLLLALSAPQALVPFALLGAHFIAALQPEFLPACTDALFVPFVLCAQFGPSLLGSELFTLSFHRASFRSAASGLAALLSPSFSCTTGTAPSTWGAPHFEVFA